MPLKYRIHNAPTPYAIDQAVRLGSNLVIVHSIGPCSHLRFERDPFHGRLMDEFPQYFEDYPRVAELRRSADSTWLEPLRREIRSLCGRAEAQGMGPVFHLYEPMLPLAFENEYPELVGIYKRRTQDGIIDVHTRLDPDNPATWDLVKHKYRELARDFPQVAMFIVTTGDIAGTMWCMPQAEMPLHRRLVRMVESAREGVREAGSSAVVCFRLWWRNFPDELYRDGHRLIAETTGLEDAADLMNPIGKPCNAPSDVLPKLFKELPDDVPVMFKSTVMDIHDNSPLTHVLGTYPPEREQIMEISYEMVHEKPWPWCKVAHIRNTLAAVRQHKLAGYVSLPINMGNNTRTIDPESGNLGRMNTWLFEQLQADDSRTDRELVEAWLENECGAPQPSIVTDALLAADEIADEGIQWGRGINNREDFASLHTTKLYWFFDGFIRPDFPYKIADPDEKLIESLIRMKHDAYRRAADLVASLAAARAAIHPDLFEEIYSGYRDLADYILLRRDWSSYLLMQYGIEKGVFPPERRMLGRMSRYAETFIRNVVRLKDTPAWQRMTAKMSFPDAFPLS